MKAPVSPRTAVLFFLGTLVPLAAQNLQESDRSPEVRPILVGDLTGNDHHRFSPGATPPERFEVPAVGKAPAQLPEGGAYYVAQDAMTLGPIIAPARSLDDVADLNLLREPSPFRKLAVSASSRSYQISGGGLQSGLALLSAVYRQAGTPSEGADCLGVGLSVQQQVRLDPAKLFALVESEVAANPNCSCEIVKYAIRANGSDPSGVADIVEVAATAAPDMMRLISQCAIAEVPEALAEVQAVLARIEPGAGESARSAKGAKSAKGSKVAQVAAITPPIPPNPLDRPYLPPLPPIIIHPPPVTPVDPGKD